MTKRCIVIIGKGRMGNAVRALAEAQQWTVAAHLGRAQTENDEALFSAVRGADVALEFTTPIDAPTLLVRLAGAGCPIVSGTTGWLEQRDRVERAVRDHDGALLWAPNFALGVHVLWRAAAHAARIFAGLPGFAPHIIETHHAAKRDAPSGTALELQHRVQKAWGTAVPVTSVRLGHVPGTHSLVVDGTFEQLRLVHEARDRLVFAEGALTAAAWLAERWDEGKRGLFGMDDLLDHALDDASAGRQ
ncbi:MAG TPA: dihydrodipicolinate reductase C-terminal domain-containing protein [Gemmatimonadaceae bacterium]|nr:dihydrodipicolinate reductase C-terminal domain-containing protein [Gemmatimonadaceae bacterium]